MRGAAAMIRPILIYGIVIAALAVLMAWMDYRHLARAWTTEFYVAMVAVIFVALGIWLGNRLTPRVRAAGFERNEQALAYLGISARECEVLELLAAGQSNKVIARRLSISPNTVKTHVAKLFEKLEAASRTQAVAKARELRLLP
jgi:DNA-binding CsgD family transcriptional regulator